MERNIPPPTEFVKVQTAELAKQKTADVNFPNKRKNRGLWFAGILAVLLLAIASIAAYRIFLPNSSGVPFEKREIQRLTALGSVLDAVISADGKYLIYAQDEGELQSLWVKQIATGSSVQVVPSANVVYQGISVSSDGSWIYYNIWDRKSVGQIFRVPMLGGIPQKVVHDAMPNVEISPDGRQLAFIRSYDRERRQDLIALDVETIDRRQAVVSGERVLASSGWSGGIYAFTWSPDSQSLAVITNRANEKGESVNLLVELFVDGRAEKVIWEIPSRVKDINSGLIWKPDKSGILTTITEMQDPYSQIWQISYPDGEALRLTKDINSYGRLSTTADGKNLVSVQQEISAGLWVLNLDKTGQSEKITDGKIEGLDASWTADGRIIYTSAIGGNIDIWITDADGTNKKQLTSDAYVETSPCVTPDGKTIAYSSNRDNGYWNIWLMNMDGTNQRKLLQSGLQWDIRCSELTNSFFYRGIGKSSDSEDNQEGFWKVSTTDQEPTFVWSRSPFLPDLSPDEKILAYTIWNSDKRQLEQQIYSLETAKSEVVELPPSAVGEGGRKEPSIKWTADGRDISFLNEEKSIVNIWIKSLRDGKLKKVSNFNENKIYGYEFSRDGKKLLVLRGLVSRDALMIKENN